MKRPSTGGRSRARFQFLNRSMRGSRLTFPVANLPWKVDALRWMASSPWRSSAFAEHARSKTILGRLSHFLFVRMHHPREVMQPSMDGFGVQPLGHRTSRIRLWTAFEPCMHLPWMVPNPIHMGSASLVRDARLHVRSASTFHGRFLRLRLQSQHLPRKVDRFECGVDPPNGTSRLTPSRSCLRSSVNQIGSR